MPFDEDNEKETVQKVGLKKVSSQKSIFDSMPKKPSLKDLQDKVNEIEKKDFGYKQRATELSLAFKKIMADKTLSQNKNVFSQELEQETFSKLMNLASDINNDEDEKEGMGSLMLIALMFKTLLYQRDQINKMEYLLSEIEKKLNSPAFRAQIIQEISVALDKKKINE